MKRFVLITAALGALVATGAAVAHLKAADVAAASATLTATTPSNVETRTYTCDTQTFEVTTGRWSGTATSTTADLNGAAVLHLKSVYNVTKKLGWVDGRLKISGADDRTHLGLTAVNTDGKLDGWVRGHAGRGDGIALRQPLGRVLEDRRADRRRDRQRHRHERGGDREGHPLQVREDAEAERAPLRPWSGRGAQRDVDHRQAEGRLGLADLHRQGRRRRRARQGGRPGRDDLQPGRRRLGTDEGA